MGVGGCVAVWMKFWSLCDVGLVGALNPAEICFASELRGSVAC